MDFYLLILAHVTPTSVETYLNPMWKLVHCGIRKYGIEHPLKKVYIEGFIALTNGKVLL